MIGEYSFITNISQGLSAKCSSFATIYEIDRLKFLEILREKDEDFEKFYMIKDETLQKGCSRYNQRNCMICFCDTHYERECDILRYNPNRTLFHAK